MQQLIDDSRAYWDEQSAKFDHFKKIMEQSWRPMIEQMALEKATSVLEVGAGRGYCSKAIRLMIPPEANLVVTDLSPEMVEAAKLNVPADKHTAFQTLNALDKSKVFMHTPYERLDRLGLSKSLYCQHDDSHCAGR